MSSTRRRRACARARRRVGHDRSVKIGRLLGAVHPLHAFQRGVQILKPSLLPEFVPGVQRIIPRSKRFSVPVYFVNVFSPETTCAAVPCRVNVEAESKSKSSAWNLSTVTSIVHPSFAA